eukprot:1397839-Alexandrium_andersonii.AAC.1
MSRSLSLSFAPCGALESQRNNRVNARHRRLSACHMGNRRGSKLPRRGVFPRAKALLTAPVTIKWSLGAAWQNIVKLA